MPLASPCFTPSLPSLPPSPPPQDSSEVEGKSAEGREGRRGGGAPTVSRRLISSLAHCRFFHYMPHSLFSPNLYLLIPGPAVQGGGRRRRRGLLISEVMENAPRHTLQIGSDCLRVKGESFMELGKNRGESVCVCVFWVEGGRRWVLLQPNTTKK